MKHSLLIRRARTDEAPRTYRLYRDAVRFGARPYSEAQRQAWVPSDEMEPWWPDRFAQNLTWIAERDGAACGFISLRPDGHLDFFFVLAEAHGDGTADALYAALVAHARQDDLAGLTAFASLMLRPFLERRGWQVVAEETALRQGVALTRFDMVLKTL